MFYSCRTVLVRVPGNTIFGTVFYGFIDQILGVGFEVSNLDVAGMLIEFENLGADLHTPHAQGAQADFDNRTFHSGICSLMARPTAQPSSKLAARASLSGMY